MPTTQKASQFHALTPFSDPPTREQQIQMAHDRGPADENDLAQLAEFSDSQSKIGAWKYGYLRAEKLRMLAVALGAAAQPSVPSPSVGFETIEALEYHAKHGGAFFTAENLYALANIVREYETSLAYALRKLEKRENELEQLQRTVGDLAEQVENAENDREPIVFLFAFDADAPLGSIDAELALELVSLLDALEQE